MIENIWLVAAIVATFYGMYLLAIAMPVHWKQVFPQGQTQPRSKPLRWAGFIALGFAAVACFQADHGSMASLVWFMLLTASALSVAMLLSGRPEILRSLSLPWFGKSD